MQLQTNSESERVSEGIKAVTILSVLCMNILCDWIQWQRDACTKYVAKNEICMRLVMPTAGVAVAVAAST